jgi:hypothetical protein
VLPVEKLSKYLTAGVLLAALAYSGYVAAWVYRNVMADYPMEYRENAALFTSGLQWEGKNPYSLEQRPLHVNLFGPGYYWATYPFACWFGNSHQVLRTVSVAFVLASCGMLIWGLRIDRCPWWAALSGGALLLGQLGQGLSVTARPDGLGLFLLLSSLIISYRCRFSPGSLALCAVLSILGYLTKPYCVLGLPLVCLYVLLFDDKLKGLLFGLAGALGLLLSLLAMNAVYECYLTETIVAQHNIVQRSFDHLARVGGRFLIDNLGLFALVAGGVVCWTRTRPEATAPAKAGGRRRFGMLRGPLLSRKVPFPGVVLACNTVLMALALGLNPGNDVLYYQQLISPFVLWLAMPLAAQKGRWQQACLLILLTNMVWLGIQRPSWPKDHAAAWRELEGLIASHRQVFAAPHLSHLLARHGLPVYDTGQTQYALFGLQQNPTRVAENYRQRTEGFLQEVENKLVGEQFDLVLICRGYSPLMPWDDLEAHYVCHGQLQAPMTFGYWMDPYPLEVWVPRSQITSPGPNTAPPQ